MLRRTPRVAAGAALGWVARCTFAVSIMASAAVGPGILLDSIYAAEADSPADVVAGSPPNAAIEAALRDDFLVLPIRTELQRVTGRNFDKAKVLVLINGVKVIKGEDEALDAKALKLSKIWKAIEPFAKGEPSDVVFRVWCGWYVSRSLDDGTWRASSILKNALEGFGRGMGFQDAWVDVRFLSPRFEYKDNWKGAVADFAPRPGENKVDEPAVGDQQVKLYPVHTRFSRLLYHNADCVVHFIPPIDEMDVASAFETMKRCLPQLGLKKRDRVVFLYHWKSPRIADQIRDDVMGRHVYRDMLGFKGATFMVRN